MTKAIYIVCFSLILSIGSYAQCTPNAPSGTFIFPNYWDTLGCLIPGNSFSKTFYVEIDTISGLKVNYLRLDSIGVMFDVNNIVIPNTGIPPGLSYTTNLGSPPVIWQGGETGCFTISGIPAISATNCTWQINTYITIDVAGLGSISGAVGELAHQFGLSGTIGLNETLTISNLTITPNPFTSSTTIIFNSMVSGNYQAILTDVVGKEIKREDLTVTMGNNQVELNRGNLSNGLYSYSITNGQQSISKRLVLQD